MPCRGRAARESCCGVIKAGTYAEQGPGTAVVVVGHLAHGLVIIHGHSAGKTQQARSQEQAVQPPTAQARQLLLTNVMDELFPGVTKAVICSHVSLLIDQGCILQSKKYRLWMNVTGAVQEETWPSFQTVSKAGNEAEEL